MQPVRPAGDPLFSKGIPSFFLALSECIALYRAVETALCRYIPATCSCTFAPPTAPKHLPANDAADSQLVLPVVRLAKLSLGTAGNAFRKYGGLKHRRWTSVDTNLPVIFVAAFRSLRHFLPLVKDSP
jgi:hypothetical protein